MRKFLSFSLLFSEVLYIKLHDIIPFIKASHAIMLPEVKFQTFYSLALATFLYVSDWILQNNKDMKFMFLWLLKLYLPHLSKWWETLTFFRYELFLLSFFAKLKNYKKSKKKRDFWVMKCVLIFCQLKNNKKNILDNKQDSELLAFLTKTKLKLWMKSFMNDCWILNSDFPLVSTKWKIGGKLFFFAVFLSIM